MKEMDHYELMAWDLEEAQQNRFRKHPVEITDEGKIEDVGDFWTYRELQIHKQILRFRSNSESFHPNNRR